MCSAIRQLLFLVRSSTKCVMPRLCRGAASRAVSVTAKDRELGFWLLQFCIVEGGIDITAARAGLFHMLSGSAFPCCCCAALWLRLWRMDLTGAALLSSSSSSSPTAAAADSRGVLSAETCSEERSIRGPIEPLLACWQWPLPGLGGLPAKPPWLPCFVSACRTACWLGLCLRPCRQSPGLT